MPILFVCIALLACIGAAALTPAPWCWLLLLIDVLFASALRASYRRFRRTGRP
jgi:hypothetical protein